MRLFIGLPIPQALAQNLAARANALALPKARVSPPENLHITLVFLGHVVDEKIPAIQTQLARIEATSFEVTVRGFDTFARAGILFAEVEATPKLLKLQAHVEELMSACGFAPEPRPYHPHITLARNRGPLNPAIVSKLRPQKFLASHVNLYRSVSTPAGSRYEVINSKNFSVRLR
jgi:RNA 2',3'-cyclic 3'-phosphodiesterase